MKTQHLDEERTQRVVDRELAAAEMEPIEAHLASCAACRDKVAATKREQDAMRALFLSLDELSLHEPASVAVAMPTPLARRGVVSAGVAGRPGRRVLLRRAAIVVLAIGLAGAAYAAPGSPLPELVRQIARKIGGLPAETPQPRDIPLRDTSEGPPAVSGIGIPADSPIQIVFTTGQASGGARVSFTDGETITVRGPAGAARFASEADRLVIDNEGTTATYDIEIPRNAPRVEIRLGERRLFLKEGDRLVGPPPDASGVHLLDLRSP